MTKTVGHIAKYNGEIDAPIKFKFKDFEFSKLALLVGTNGSGKTLILKINWCLSYIAEMFIAKKRAGDNSSTIDMVQYIFDKSFEDQDFNGELGCVFTNTGSIKIIFEKGKVTEAIIDIDDDVENQGLPIFMSKDTRTFDAYKRYLQTRKLIGIKGDISMNHPSLMEKLLEQYKLYDVIFLERIIGILLQKPIILKKSMKESLNDTFEITVQIESIGLDENKSELYYVDSTGKVGLLTKLSAGEQSLINMIVNSQLVLS